MSTGPVITLFASANRPELWPRLYNSLLCNDIPFELVFVGNKLSGFTLPDNFHFIYSEVKPSQCYEIACRYSCGEFIMGITDDLVFSEHALDILYREYVNINNDRVIVSPRFSYGENNVFGDEKCRVWVGDDKTPLLPVAGLMKKQFWEHLGGIDQRFVALTWDIDIVCRAYEMGGSVIYCDQALVTELHIKKGDYRSLYHEVGKLVDRALLEWLWIRQGPLPATLSPDSIYSTQGDSIMMKNRLSPVIPFRDKHLLTVSQGPKGKWK